VHDYPFNPEIRLVDGAFYAADPHRHFQWMREHAPVYWDATGNVWGITRYEDVLAVSRDPQTFCNGQGMRPDTPSLPYMINLDDPLHKKRRALVNKGFTPRRVAEREPRIRAVCVDLIERAKARRRFDFVRDVAAWLPLIVIGDMLGVTEEAHARLLEWSDEMLGATGSADPSKLARAQDAFLEYREYQSQVVADRRANPQNDLMSVLVHAEIDGEKLDDEEVLMESLLILIGGDETTRHVISGGMYELLRYPQQRRALIEDATKIATAVEEMLRWVTPIQNMARTATADVTLRGQHIKAGEKLMLLYPSANRDASVFADPFTFNIERAPNEHLAFGYGAHFCLGSSLARLELRVMFEELLQRLPTLELATDDPPQMRASNFISGIESLPVEVREPLP
jgi:cytochrome P450 family 142 subfamily A polypeptide 1